MAPDPSPSQLPREGESPTEWTLRMAREEWTAPLIAERDQARAEARRLREALEWYSDRGNYCPNGRPGAQVGREWIADRGGRARAALSASPVSEKGQYGRNFREAIADIEKLPASERSAIANRSAPVSVPERTWPRTWPGPETYEPVPVTPEESRARVRASIERATTPEEEGRTRWTMPEWMRWYAGLMVVGGNEFGQEAVEARLNSRPSSNGDPHDLVMRASAGAQVILLRALNDRNLLRGPDDRAPLPLRQRLTSEETLEAVAHSLHLEFHGLDGVCPGCTLRARAAVVAVADAVLNDNDKEGR